MHNHARSRNPRWAIFTPPNSARDPQVLLLAQLLPTLIKTVPPSSPSAPFAHPACKALQSLQRLAELAKRPGRAWVLYSKTPRISALGEAGKGDCTVRGAPFGVWGAARSCSGPPCTPAEGAAASRILPGSLYRFNSAQASGPRQRNPDPLPRQARFRPARCEFLPLVPRHGESRPLLETARKPSAVQ